MLEIKENVSLANLTSFRIGGAAKYFVEIENKNQLEEILEHVKKNSLPFYVLGGGTNVLVSDKGFDGVVIKIKMNELKFEGENALMDAGVPLIKAVKSSAAQGLEGLEALAGVPGTVGGAVRGNAGAYGSVIGEVVENVLAYDTEKMEFLNFEKKDCDFSYRSSVFKKNPNLIVLSIKLKLAKGSKEVSEQKVQETIEKRIANELQGVKSAGSFFMNPTVQNQELLDKFQRERGVPAREGKIPAGWLIDQAGLRGKKIGGAVVNEKHANYITNAENATAEDVIMLVSVVKQKVRDEFGVQLQQEVNYLGF